MASLGSLVVSLAVDIARFQGDLGRAAAIAESRMRNIKDTASRSLGAVAAIAGVAGVALGVALKGAIDRADDFRDLAAGAGVTVEAFSQLQFAAAQSGVETETLARALAKLASEGSKNVTEDLGKIADQFAQMPDGAKKTAAAIEVFGERLGPGLIPLLNEGSAGLKRLADESDRSGNTIRTSTAAAADELNDRLGSLHATATGLANTLAGEMLPSLNGFVGYMQAAAQNGETFRTGIGGVTAFLKGIISAADFAATTFASLARTIGATFSVIGAGMTGNWSEIPKIIRDRNADAEKETSGFFSRMVGMWEGAGVEIAQKAPTISKNFVSPLAQAAAKERELLKRIAEQRQADIETRKNRHESFSDSVDEFAPLVESLQNAKIELDDFTQFTVQQADIAKAAWAEQAAAMNEQFVDRLLALRGNFRDFLKDLLRMFAQSQLKEGLMGIFGSGGSFGSNGFAGFVGDLFGGFFAGGGDPPVGKYSVVGENGPELIFPKGASTVVPAGAMGGGGGGPVVIHQSNSYSGLGLSYDQVLALQERNNRDLLRAFQDSQDRQGQRVTRFSR